MVYYKKGSEEKIIHVGWCTHVHRMAWGSIGKFRTAEEALQKGYRICRCCENEMRAHGMLKKASAPRKAVSPAPSMPWAIPAASEQMRIAF